MSFNDLEVMYKALWVTDSSGLESRTHDNLRLRIVAKSIDIQRCLDSLQEKYQESESLFDDVDTNQIKKMLKRLFCDMINLCLFWFILQKIPFSEVYEGMMQGIIQKFYKFSYGGNSGWK